MKPKPKPKKKLLRPRRITKTLGRPPKAYLLGPNPQLSPLMAYLEKHVNRIPIREKLPSGKYINVMLGELNLKRFIYWVNRLHKEVKV